MPGARTTPTLLPSSADLYSWLLTHLDSLKRDISRQASVVLPSLSTAHQTRSHWQLVTTAWVTVHRQWQRRMDMGGRQAADCILEFRGFAISCMLRAIVQKMKLGLEP